MARRRKRSGSTGQAADGWQGALTMTPGRVWMIEGPKETMPRTRDALKRKRCAIWHHMERNRLVAAVAQALKDGDVRALQQYGIELLPADLGPNRLARQVVILVESTEH